MVSAEILEEHVTISIQDQCGGLEVEKIDSLFKPFTSGGFDQSGMGLGLTIVKRAVHLLQGQITVKNQPGKGCSFLVKIPMKLGPPLEPSRTVSGIDSVRPAPKK
jgi:signal transduction histidine kinase